MAALVTSDTHFTNKPVDEYKWNLFPWIHERIPKYKITEFFILGDILNEKDNHGSHLINRLIDNLLDLTKKGLNIYLIRGNHDYQVDFTTPFLKFTSNIPGIHFYTEPTDLDLPGIKIKLLPNTKNPTEDWKGLDLSQADFIFTHQTYDGCVAENGHILKGVSHHVFDNIKAQVISGDIHKAQSLHNGKIIYVGEPYDNRFGNVSHYHRLLLIEDDAIRERKSLVVMEYDTVRRLTLNIIDPAELASIPVNPQDQVKLICQLKDPLEWDKTKKELIQMCKDRKLDIHETRMVKSGEATKIVDESKLQNLTPQQILEEYVKHANIKEQYLPYATKILEELK